MNSCLPHVPKGTTTSGGASAVTTRPGVLRAVGGRWLPRLWAKKPSGAVRISRGWLAKSPSTTSQTGLYAGQLGPDGQPWRGRVPGADRCWRRGGGDVSVRTACRRSLSGNRGDAAAQHRLRERASLAFPGQPRDKRGLSRRGTIPHQALDRETSCKPWLSCRAAGAGPE